MFLTRKSQVKATVYERMSVLKLQSQRWGENSVWGFPGKLLSSPYICECAMLMLLDVRMKSSNMQTGIANCDTINTIVFVKKDNLFPTHNLYNKNRIVLIPISPIYFNII